MVLSSEAHCRAVHSCSNSTRLSGEGHPMINSPVLVSCCDQHQTRTNLRKGLFEGNIVYHGREGTAAGT